MRSRSIMQWFGLALAALLGGACVADDPISGPPYDVVVLDRVADPMNDGQSVFALQRRSLEAVTSFSRLESPAFRVRQGGTFTATLTSDGDVIRSGVFEGGRDPDLRYVVEDGSAVPRDDTTLLMFTVAYQFNHLLPRLVAATAPDVGSAFITRGPMNINLGPQTLVKAIGAEVTIRKITNAFFATSGWEFGIERSSAAERVPLGADPRVLAHELGHAVFHLVFFGGDEADCDAAQAEAHATDPWFPGRLSNELAIGGLNEGYADWLSFAVTGGTNPTEILDLQPAYGLPENQVRILTEDNFRWGDIFKIEGNSTSPACEGMYCLGTLFARSLVATYLAQGHTIADETARHEFSRAVASALRGTAARMQAIGLPPPTEAVANCERRDDVSTQLDPPVIGSFLEALLAGLAPEQAAVLCTELARRFEDGFPVEFRKGCSP
jgi:hypothetical protein